MTTDRRDFLKGAALGGAMLAAGLALPGARRVFAQGGQKKLEILVLGGTRFLGPAIVDFARARGHEVTLFNRGKSAPDMYPELETLIGDRDGDLTALEKGSWDAVIDTSGYVPRVVTDSATLLADRVKQYVFISSKSVYVDLPSPGLDESQPVATLADPTVEEITGETYGALKALCEQAAEATMPGRVTNIRPGLIVGPMDQSDRFTYWPERVKRGGEVLAPGTGLDFFQYIDVRDLGAWIVKCVEDKTMGVYNAVTPGGAYTIKGLLQESRAITGSDATFTWVNADFLEKNDVTPYRDMPCWVPQTGEYLGFALVSSKKARKAGLRTRSLATTIRDTLAWWEKEPEERRQAGLRAGLSQARETELLDMWHGRTAPAEPESSGEGEDG